MRRKVFGSKRLGKTSLKATPKNPVGKGRKEKEKDAKLTKKSPYI